MFIIATTRFNTETWKENVKWRKAHKWTGCVYGTPKRVSDTHLPRIPIFVLEMHNDKNKIKGVGLVKNVPVMNQHHKIYSDCNYNRYTYKSEYRISRREMTREEKKIIRIFDQLLFKGSRHLKRGQGIIAVPDRIIKTKCMNLTMFFRNMFKARFPIERKDVNVDVDVDMKAEGEKNIQK
tara:strand:+ start:1956 stop:2495 length:540 start_codon:yes stop_codon:yes gene_type:complete